MLIAGLPLVYGGFSQTKCGLIESATAARESQSLFPDVIACVVPPRSFRLTPSFPPTGHSDSSR